MMPSQQAQAAMTALHRGEAASARRGFEAAISGGLTDPAAYLGLALAHQALRDEPAMMAALDLCLAGDPGNLRALLMKADTYAARGNLRAAVGWYAQVTGRAPDPSAFSPDARREIERAHAQHAALQARIFEQLSSSLSSSGLDARASKRFARSLDLMTGRAQRFEQTPTSFYMPGFAAIPFPDRALFPWLAQVEDATDAIRAELEPLLVEPDLWSPYIEAEADRPVDTSHNMLNSGNWTACYLWKEGRRVDAIAERCPRTLLALDGLPLETIAGRSPFILFSKLTPGAWIKPHSGYMNPRLVVHVPLIVPPGCWFRVGAERREWFPGEAFVFDDTIDHEAKNEGAGTRVVLIFNIWRPELTAEERSLVAALMEAVDRL